MPLRAILDGKNIQSFDYSLCDWSQLKSSYKNKVLIMACCDRKAIPKVSKLGTKYFAHSRKGECKSAPETQEHIELKTIVAKAALFKGWTVVTEQKGQTPSGENWIADVMCSREKVKVAIEIQWSNQSDDEYIRRTRKYKESGVRCIWLFRCHGPKLDHKTSESYELPRFEVQLEEKLYLIPKFAIQVSEFIEGLLCGDLRFSPHPRDVLTYCVKYMSVACWQCQKRTNMIHSVEVRNERYQYLSLCSFNDGSLQWFRDNLSKTLLNNLGIGEIISRPLADPYGDRLSNSCIHCRNFLEPFHYDTAWQYASLNSFEIKSNDVTYPLKFQGEWRFCGKAGKA